MKIFQNLTQILFLGVIAFSLSQCSSGEKLAGDGSGTQTGNPSVTGFAVDSTGTLLPNANVILRKSDYLSPIPSAMAKAPADFFNGRTDSLGGFRLDSIIPGNYILEINNNEGLSLAQKILVEENSTLVLDTLNLKPNGIITGYIPVSDNMANGLFIQIFGLERLVEVNSDSGFFSFTNIPEGIYDLRLVSRDSNSVDTVFEDVSASPGAITEISYYPDWSYRASIDLGLDSLLQDQNESISDFPMLIRLTSENFDFSQARKEAEDLRFLNNQQIEIPFEVEYWDSATALGIVWVKVDSLSQAKNNSIQMLWGNSMGKSAENSFSVFDSSQDYLAVWHMGQSGGDIMMDATRHSVKGAPEGMDGSSDVIGQIGRSQIFDGLASQIVVSDSSQGTIPKINLSSYMLSSWVYLDSLVENNQTIFSSANGEISLSVSASGQWEYIEKRDSLNSDTLNWQAKSNEWVYLAMGRVGDNLNFYVNGELVAEKQTSSVSQENVSWQGFLIGKGPVDNSLWFRGKIDEVRVLRATRTSDWIRLCYESQKSGHIAKLNIK